MNQARYAYLECICELVEQGRDIVIVSEDYAAPIFDAFRRQYPERFLSVGIAEQNGIAVACGLALAGKYPIVYGCSPFPLTRAVDQIKSAVAGMHLPMTIFNAGIGFGIPEFGATHYNMDDLAIVRAIPGIRIITPSDVTMAKQLAGYSLQSGQPLYVRMDKNSEGMIYDERVDNVHFEKGFSVLKSNPQKDKAVVVSCASMVRTVLEIARELEKADNHVRVIDLYSLPFDEDAFLNEVAALPIVSVEEHIIQGGIGTAVLETINSRQAKNEVTRMGVCFDGAYPVESGSQEYFMKRFGLGYDDIRKALQRVCRDNIKDSRL